MVKYIGLILAMFLCSCATSPERVVVHEIKTVYKPIPKNLLERCKVDKPMAVDKYLTLDDKAKETWMTDYIIQIYDNIGTCNNKLKAIEAFDKSQSELYK